MYKFLINLIAPNIFANSPDSMKLKGLFEETVQLYTGIILLVSSVMMVCFFYFILNNNSSRYNTMKVWMILGAVNFFINIFIPILVGVVILGGIIFSPQQEILGIINGLYSVFLFILMSLVFRKYSAGGRYTPNWFIK